MSKTFDLLDFGGLTPFDLEIGEDLLDLGFDNAFLDEAEDVGLGLDPGSITIFFLAFRIDVLKANILFF